MSQPSATANGLAGPWLISNAVRQITMGILSQIFGSDRSDGQFRSAIQHLSNRVDQSERNSGRIQVLRNSGVSERDRRSLKVYFITNSREKAKALIAELSALGHRCEWSPPSGRDNEFIVSGVTCDLSMNDEQIMKWTDEMCDLAAGLDCEFEHWTLQ